MKTASFLFLAFASSAAGDAFASSDVSSYSISHRRLNLLGGTLALQADRDNPSDEGEGMLVAASGLSNDGRLALRGNKVLGDLHQPFGVISVFGAKDTVFVDDVVNNGEIHIGEGSRGVFCSRFAGAGLVTGKGTALMKGVVAPGNSPGTVRFAGDLVLASTSTLEIELSGTVPGIEFDSVEVAGTVLLAGTLDVQLIDSENGPFRPSAGDTFEILSSEDGINGKFTMARLPELAGQLSWDIRYTAGAVVLEVFATHTCDINGDGRCDVSDIDAMTQNVLDGANTLLDRVELIERPAPGGFYTYFGDANLDGMFDSDDLIEVFSAGKYTTGETAGWAEGDFDGDQDFDSDDLIEALAGGGYQQGPRPEVNAVPEPTSVVVLALGLLVMTFPRTRDAVVHL